MARLGLFDDLVPQGQTGGPAARGRFGMFDDLIPEGMGGLQPDASPIDYAAQSMTASQARMPGPVSPEQDFADVRAFANQQMQQPAQGGGQDESRWGDALKPAFGGHNPIAETFDRVIQPFLPESMGGKPDAGTQEEQQWLDQRGIGERAADTAAFAASMPARMLTRGEYGAGDVLSGLGFEGAGQSVSQAEQDFMRANQKQLEAAALVGDAALGATGASMTPLMARNPPRPRVEGAPHTVQPTAPPPRVQPSLGPQPAPAPAPAPPAPAMPAPVPTYQTPPMPQMASGPWAGVARARNYVRDATEQNLPVFGPAVAQAARGGEGVGAMTRMIQSIPGVGRRMEMKNQEFLDAAGRRVDDIAGNYARVGDPEQAGGLARAYYDRFVNERAIDRDTIRSMPDDALQRLASQAPRDIGSLKTAKDARYERAWRNIPEEYRNGQGFVEEARLMGQMPATREFLRGIYDSNVRKVNAQAEAARVRPQTRRGGDNPAEPGVLPTRQGGMVDALVPFRDGILGRSVRAILDGNWSGTLQTMRDIRSDIRRANSRVADTEGNVLNKAQLNQLHHAVSRDMDTLMQRMANDFANGRPARGGQPAIRANPEMAARIRKAAQDMDAADRLTARYARILEDLQSITKAKNDIGIIDRVISAARDNSQANTNMLLRIRQTAPHDVLDAIASGVINHIGAPTGSARGATQEANFSIGKAVTAWNNMGARQRQLIFGHRPELYRQLNQFFRVAQGIADFENLRNTSRSGTHMIASSLLLAGPAAILTSLPALLWTAAAATGVAYFLTSPSYVSWLTRGMKIQDAINKGEISATAARAAVERQSKALARIVSKDKKLDPGAARSILTGLARQTPRAIGASGMNSMGED